MRTYIFYYFDSYDSMLNLNYKEFTVSGSTFRISFSRFFDFFRNLKSEYIGYFPSYKIVSASGKVSSRSFKQTDLIYLSKIQSARKYCYSDSYCKDIEND